MKKRGFTLIELLAVIVVLAVVALIAFPIIAGIIEKTKRSAAYRSVEGYVEAANNAAVLYDIDNNKGINVTEAKHTFTSNVDTEDFSKIKAKGTLPTYSYLDFDINKKVVTEGHFCINGYSVLYSEGTAKASETKYCEEDNTGSGSNSGSGNSGSSGNIDSALLNVRYEALGEKDDYLYVKVDDEWKKWQKANLRWDGYIFNAGDYDQEKLGNWSIVWDSTKGNRGGTDSQPSNASKSYGWTDLAYIYGRVSWNGWLGTHGAYLIKQEALPKGFKKIKVDLQFIGSGSGCGQNGSTTVCAVTPVLTNGEIRILSSNNNVNSVLTSKTFPASRSVVEVDLTGYEERDIFLAFRFTSDTSTLVTNSSNYIELRVHSIQMQ